MVRLLLIIGLSILFSSCKSVAKSINDTIKTRADVMLVYKNYNDEINLNIINKSDISIKLNEGLQLDTSIIPSYFHQIIDSNITNQLMEIDFINGWEFTVTPDTLNMETGLEIVHRNRKDILNKFKENYKIDKFINVCDEDNNNIGYLVYTTLKEKDERSILNNLFFLKMTKSKITSIVNIASYWWWRGYPSEGNQVRYLGNGEFYLYDYGKLAYLEKGEKIIREEILYTKFRFNSEGKLELIPD